MTDIAPMRPASSSASEKRVRTQRTAIIVLCFVALGSGVAGAALDRLYTHVRTPRAVLSDTNFHPLSQALRTPDDDDRRQIREELQRELDLTPAQDSSIRTILMQRSGEFAALREEMRPRVEALVHLVRADIEQILTPDQRTRFHSFQARGPEALGSNAATVSP
jgi:hypothetical protein